MKNDQCIDLIENILRANYIPLYRFTLPCTNPEQLDLGLRTYLLGIRNSVEFFNNAFEKLKPEKIYITTDHFLCTFVFLLLPDEKTVLHCGPVLFEKFRMNVLRKFSKA